MSFMSCRISQHSFGVKLQRQDAELSPLYSPFILCCSLQSGKAFQHSSSLTSHRTAATQPSDHSSSSQGIQNYKQDILPGPPRTQMCSISQMPVILRCCPPPSNSSQWLKHRTVPS